MLKFMDYEWFESLQEVTDWMAKNEKVDILSIEVDIEDFKGVLKPEASISVASDKFTKFLGKEFKIDEDGENENSIDELFFHNFEEFAEFAKDLGAIADQFYESYDLDVTVNFVVGTAVSRLDVKNTERAKNSERFIEEALNVINSRPNDFVEGYIDIDDIDFTIHPPYTHKDVEKALTDFTKENVVLEDYTVAGTYLLSNELYPMKFTDVIEFKAALEQFKNIADKFFVQYRDLEIGVELKENMIH